MLQFDQNLSLDHLISVVYLALRHIKHRGHKHRTSLRIKGLKTEPTLDDERLALRLIQQIENLEGKRLDQISDLQADHYVNTLADIIDRRTREELAGDTDRAKRILEELRKEPPSGALK
jgi:hypothetical protein